MPRIHDETNTLTKVRKQIEYWTVPPGIKDTARRFYKSYRSRQVPDEILSRCRSNAELHNQFEGERCFILATGSSINDQDLRPIKDEYCIGMSMFFLHDDIETISPEFYVFAPNHPPYDFTLPQRYVEGFKYNLGEGTKPVAF